MSPQVFCILPVNLRNFFVIDSNDDAVKARWFVGRKEEFAKNQDVVVTSSLTDQISSARSAFMEDTETTVNAIDSPIALKNSTMQPGSPPTG